MFVPPRDRRSVRTEESRMPSSTQPEPKGITPPRSAVGSARATAGWYGMWRGMALV